MFEIGPDTYIAYDADDVWGLLEEQTGLTRDDDDMEGEEPLIVPNDRVLTIRIEEDDTNTITLTASEWCAREGRGFLCSTEY